MKVPFELRYKLTNQISLSKKNEELKRLPEIAIELKKKISNAIKQLPIDTLEEKSFQKLKI